MLMDGSLIEQPVVLIYVDTPYYRGQVKAVAMERPVYDIVIGNIPGARNPDKPDIEWKPEEVERTGAVTTRSQRQGKPLPPLKVAKDKLARTAAERTSTIKQDKECCLAKTQHEELQLEETVKP